MITIFCYTFNVYKIFSYAFFLLIVATIISFILGSDFLFEKDAIFFLIISYIGLCLLFVVYSFFDSFFSIKRNGMIAKIAARLSRKLAKFSKKMEPVTDLERFISSLLAFFVLTVIVVVGTIFSFRVGVIYLLNFYPHTVKNGLELLTQSKSLNDRFDIFDQKLNMLLSDYEISKEEEFLSENPEELTNSIWKLKYISSEKVNDLNYSYAYILSSCLDVDTYADGTCNTVYPYGPPSGIYNRYNSNFIYLSQNEKLLSLSVEVVPTEFLEYDSYIIKVETSRGTDSYFVFPEYQFYPNYLFDSELERYDDEKITYEVVETNADNVIIKRSLAGEYQDRVEFFKLYVLGNTSRFEVIDNTEQY